MLSCGHSAHFDDSLASQAFGCRVSSQESMSMLRSVERDYSSGMGFLEFSKLSLFFDCYFAQAELAVA